MSWIKVQHQSHLSRTGVDEKGFKTATEYYVAKNSADTNTVAAETATDGSVTVPKRGRAHPFDASRKCKTVEVTNMDNNTRRVFQIRAEYSNHPDIVEDPLDVPPKWTWDFQEAGSVPYFIDNTSDDDD